MTLAQMHREDIKAALRKKYGTIRQFEAEHGFAPGSVHDVLRRRRWARVEKAIEKAIGSPVPQSEKTDSRGAEVSHDSNSRTRKAVRA